ncbi:restriction endonuclease subunit S [Malaciobacter sp. WC5094]
MSNVPKLRFKEFTDEWEVKAVNELAKVNPKSKNLPDEFVYIDLESVEKGILVKESIVTKNEAPSRAQRLLENDDILFQMVRPYQKNNFYFSLGQNYVASTGYAQLRANESPQFLYHKLHTEKFANDVIVRCTGTSYPAINSTDLATIKVSVPSKYEQEKIASFLNKVDTKVEQLTKKEELLKQYKKGVIQKIFLQEIRFKADDGSKFEDWEVKNVGQCINHIAGTALEKYVSDEAKYNFISIGNYSTTGRYIDNGQRVLLNEKTRTKLLEKDDLVMVLNDKTSSGDIIGSTIHIDKNDKYIYNQRSERIICKDDILPLYFWHYFNSQMFRKKVFSLAQGGTQIYINFSSIKSIETSIPSLEEQTKIANFLSSINTKIEQVQKQLESTKQFKKALLQQMFV